MPSTLFHREVKFSLQFGGMNIGSMLNSFDEGVEFSFRNLNSSSREWIPLMFYSSRCTNTRNGRIYIGEVNDTSGQVKIRGYDVPYIIISNDASQSLEPRVIICGSEISQHSGQFNWIQFRWLQTVTQTSDPNRDRIVLDDIAISSYLTQQHIVKIFADDFNNQTTTK